MKNLLPARGPLLAGKQARGNLDHAGEGLENGDGRPASSITRGEGALVELLGHLLEGDVLNEQFHHEFERLHFLGVLFQVLAVAGDAQAIGYFFKQRGYWGGFSFGFALPLERGESPAFVALLLQVFEVQRLCPNLSKVSAPVQKSP